MAVSTSTGTRRMGAPGRWGTWPNGERSVIHAGSSSSRAQLAEYDEARRARPTTAAAAHRGSSPTAATARPITTHTAGSWTSAPASTRATCDGSLDWSACAVPDVTPAASSITTAPPAASRTWPPAQRTRPTEVASTASARCDVSSDRSRSTAWTPYAPATTPRMPISVARNASVSAWVPPNFAMTSLAASLSKKSPTPSATAPITTPIERESHRVGEQHAPLQPPGQA